MSERHNETIWILDFGSQYTQLIARRVRELGVFSRVVAPTISPDEIDWDHAKGLIFSGGPASVSDRNAPVCDERLLRHDLPKLGICYGWQLYAQVQGGTLSASTAREYGRASLRRLADNPIWDDLPKEFTVWMSHGDTVTRLPEGVVAIAETDSVATAAVYDPAQKFWGLQFHPEVEHTENGRTILKSFLYDICGCQGGWDAGVFTEDAMSEIRDQVGDGHVLLGVSGGVDSAVLAVLLQEAIGDRLHPVFVDTGLLRSGEVAEVIAILKTAGVDIDVVDASDRFLSALDGVVDPEEKRKAIGRLFIQIFEEESNRIGQVAFLAQGTLYPDWIESVSVDGPSAVIKSHHNVGGLPERMNLKLVEPLKWLFKDEVRAAGRVLGLPDDLLGRHPFPGPGLAIRIPGAVTRPDVDLLRQADRIFIDELRRAGWYDQVWQAFSVLLPVRSVGVMGDRRTYERALCLRAVVSVDGMTADWAELPYAILKTVSNRIINEVPGINRVCYDVSSKPPATIEWE